MIEAKPATFFFKQLFADDHYLKDVNQWLFYKIKLCGSLQFLKKYCEKLLSKDYPDKKFAKLAAKVKNSDLDRTVAARLPA
jgi:hypothetical protein